MDDSDCYYSCLMERECTAFALFPFASQMQQGEAGGGGTCELYRQCLIEAGSATVQIWLEMNEATSKKAPSSLHGPHSRQQANHKQAGSNDNALKRFASKFRLRANQSLHKPDAVQSDAELDGWWRRNLWLNASATSRQPQPRLPPEPSPTVLVTNSPASLLAASNLTRRRRLFFHGNKNDLVVDKSMAYKWIKDMKSLLQLRVSTINVPDANWQFLTPSQKLSSLFSDEFIAKYDALLAPYGYSMSQPERLTTPTVFRGLGPAPTVVNIDWQQLFAN